MNLLNLPDEDPNILHSEETYVIPLDANYIWVEVAGIALWIRHDGDTLQVEAYPKFDEIDQEPMAQLSYRFDDVDYSEDALEELWDALEQIGIDDDGHIDTPFLYFPAGTDRERIWRWFDDRHPRGVAYLLNVRGFNDAQ